MLARCELPVAVWTTDVQNKGLSSKQWYWFHKAYLFENNFKYTSHVILKIFSSCINTSLLKNMTPFMPGCKSSAGLLWVRASCFSASSSYCQTNLLLYWILSEVTKKSPTVTEFCSTVVGSVAKMYFARIWATLKYVLEPAFLKLSVF